MKAQGTPPLHECRSHVCIAELETEGAPGDSRAVTLCFPIDAVQDDAQRNSIERPAADQLEAGSENPNELSFVDAGQVLFDAPAVLSDVESRNGRR